MNRAALTLRCAPHALPLARGSLPSNSFISGYASVMIITIRSHARRGICGARCRPAAERST